MRFDRRVHDLAKRYGFKLSMRRGGHARLDRDGYPTIWCSVSPKNQDHALRNIERDIRRALFREVVK